MKIIKFYLVAFLVISTNQLFSQTDMAYNPLLALNISGNDQGQTHRQIGNYKIKGSSYLFNNVFQATVYHNTQIFSGKKATYDTYYQKIENADEAGNMTAFELSDADSFKVVYVDAENGNNYNKTFIHSSIADSSLKKPVFLEKLATGPKFSLYKFHTSTLEDYVSSIAQTTGYKQFKQKTEYYYISPETKKLTKLKLTESDLKKALGNISPVNALFEDSFYNEPESAVVNFINTSVNGKG
jgi:hypothetical protein